MQVRKLMELLARCDPDAFVTVALPDSSEPYVNCLMDTPAALLWFRVEEWDSCSYTEFPHLPGMSQVVLNASLDGHFPNPVGNPALRASLAPSVVPPDLRPEAG